MASQTFSNTLSGHRIGRRALVTVPLTVVLSDSAFPMATGGDDTAEASENETISDVRVAGGALEGKAREQARKTLEEETLLEGRRLTPAGSERWIRLDHKSVKLPSPQGHVRDGRSDTELGGAAGGLVSVVRGWQAE